MKKKASVLLTIIVVIALWPLYLLFLITCCVFLLVFFIKEYPLYKKSACYKHTKLKYAHWFYISDCYKIYPSILNENIDIELIRDNKNSHYYQGKNIYFFKDCSMYFQIQEGNLYVSLDGHPYILFYEYINNRCIDSENKKYILLLEEDCVDVFGEKLVLSQHDHIIVGIDYDDIARQIKFKEELT